MQLYSIAMKKIDNFNFVGNATTKNLNLNFTLMYTDLQINFIRAFGDKELKFGCILESNVSAPNCKIVSDFPWKWGYSIFYDYWLTVLGLIKYDEIWRNYTILWHEPHLFPDVAKKLREKGYNLEVLQWDTLTSIIRISRWDIKKPQIIEYKPCLPLLEQPQAMEQLLSLTK